MTVYCSNYTEKTSLAAMWCHLSIFYMISRNYVRPNDIVTKLKSQHPVVAINVLCYVSSCHSSLMLDLLPSSCHLWSEPLIGYLHCLWPCWRVLTIIFNSNDTLRVKGRDEDQNIGPFFIHSWTKQLFATDRFCHLILSPPHPFYEKQGQEVRHTSQARMS